MRTRTAIALGLLLVATASVAFAQIPPLPENHYKVYLSAPIPISRPLILQDQFGTFTVIEETFDRFSTPTEKRHTDGTVSPIHDPLIHMDWWRIFSPQPERRIIGIDQFGSGEWTVKDAAYLLTPSLKNVTGPVPIPAWNHYVCYDAIAGPLVGQPVVLIDQFGNAQVQVFHPRFFCNPAQKQADGVIYPIKDPIVHLACYVVENPISSGIPITTTDQFGFWQTQIQLNNCLCVPALKEHPVRTKQSTWGKVKSLYQN